MHWRAAPLVAIAALSCELLVPLDYSGGKEPSRATPGGQGGTTSGVAGTLITEGGRFGEGGVANEGGQPEAGAGNEGAEGGTGGDTGQGGNAAMGGSPGAGGGAGLGGDTAAYGGTSSGMGGSGGAQVDGGTGGMANSGGVGGKAGRGGKGGRGGAGMGGAGNGAGGMTAGMSGAGMAGMAGCAGDTQSNPMQCGSCTNVCDDGITCEKGKCVTSPCVGICDTWTVLPSASDGFRHDDIGNQDVCFENVGYDVAVAPKDPSLICWNFAAGRTLDVNGVMIQCIKEPGAPLTMPLHAGGYCIHASAGNETFAGLKLPIPGQIPP